jgi:hypothetical protein
VPEGGDERARWSVARAARIGVASLTCGKKRPCAKIHTGIEAGTAGTRGVDAVRGDVDEIQQIVAAGAQRMLRIERIRRADRSSCLARGLARIRTVEPADADRLIKLSRQAQSA